MYCGGNMNNFDNYLDDVFGSFEIHGITFSASTILKECDPVAYSCYLNDYESVEESCHEG
jgi:hypothetical protein